MCFCISQFGFETYLYHELCGLDCCLILRFFMNVLHDPRQSLRKMSSPVSLKDYVNTQKSAKSANLVNFSSLSNGFHKMFTAASTSYSPLSTNEFEVKIDKSEKDSSTANGNAGKSWFSSKLVASEDAFGLSRFQRIVGFCCCLLAGAICFVLASFYIPVLVFKARKFAALYTLGSGFFVFSFSLLIGPYTYLRHMFSAARFPMTAAYFVSLFATLYTSLWINSTVLTIICSGCQVFALLWFLVSYVPGGETGLKFMTGMFGKLMAKTAKAAASKTLPV